MATNPIKKINTIEAVNSILKFTVQELDINEKIINEYEDDYQLNEFAILTKDYISGF